MRNAILFNCLKATAVCIFLLLITTTSCVKENIVNNIINEEASFVGIYEGTYITEQHPEHDAKKVNFSFYEDSTISYKGIANLTGEVYFFNGTWSMEEDTVTCKMESVNVPVYTTQICKFIYDKKSQTLKKGTWSNLIGYSTNGTFSSLRKTQ